MSVSSTGTSSGRLSGGAVDSTENGTRRAVTGVDDPARSRRRPATRGGLELDEVAAVEPGVGPADVAVGDRRGDPGVEHGLGVRRLLDPQADAHAGVGVDLRGQVAVEVLGDEQQVQAERAADAGDRLELLELLAAALAGQQLAELVDDDEQPRQRRQLRLARPGQAVGVDVARPGRGEQVLAAHRLGPEQRRSSA